MNSDALQFDPWQFANNQVYAVSASTHIAFSDYERMRTVLHKASGQRRYETPLYALNDKILRELLLAFMEKRLYIRNPTGTHSERRERIRQTALAQQPRLTATVDKLNREYVQAQADHAPPERLKNLEMEIEMLDTQLRTTREGGMALVAAVAYMYHRLKLDSVGVAAELGIKPPHVRSILWKLNEVFKSKFNEDGSLKPRVVKPPHFSFDVNRAAALRATGLSWRQIAQEVGKTRGSNVCKEVRRAGLCVEKPINPKTPHVPKPTYKLIDARRAAALRATTDMTWQQIAAEVGSSSGSYVLTATKRAGLFVKKPKYVGEHNHFFGKTHSAETRAKISAATRAAMLTTKKPSAVPKRKEPRKWIDPRRVAALRDAGMSWEQIAKEVGHGRVGIFRAVQRAGLWVPTWKNKKGRFSAGKSPTGPSLPDRVCPARPTASSMLAPPTEIERRA